MLLNESKIQKLTKDIFNKLLINMRIMCEQKSRTYVWLNVTMEVPHIHSNVPLY